MSQYYKLPLTGKQVEEKLENTILTPITASVGQTVKISAVDANGKPTAWEAVDFSEGGTTSAYTNQLPLATDTDRKTVYDGDGYIDGYRLSSSGDISAQNGMSATGFIPATPGQTIRIKGATPMQGKNNYIIAYKADNTVSKYASMAYDSTGWITPHDGWMKYENGIIIILLTSTMFGSDFNAVRFCSAQLSDDVIVTIDEKITDSHVQPDWNQNDENDPSYVKNRPFYTTDPVLIDIASGTFQFNDIMGDGRLFIGIIADTNQELVIGDNITIVFDNTEYNLIIKDMNGFPYAGNLSIMNVMGASFEDTGEPFLLMKEGTSIGMYTTSVETEHNVVVKIGVCTDIKIDEKYLPDDLISKVNTMADIANTIDTKMDKSNPVGTGSFSMNRKEGTSVGGWSHAEGKNNEASGQSSHAEGSYTTASANYSHAEGQRTIASGQASHAKGQYTTASGVASHAEGSYTTASGQASHAEGRSNNKIPDNIDITNDEIIISAWESTPFSLAKGAYSHTEGLNTLALSNCSHAEGQYTTASGQSSHTEGWRTIASGQSSHAEGLGTIAQRSYQHVQGKYNIEDSFGDNELFAGAYIHIIGNGASDTERSNAHTLDWDGDAWYAGDVYVGSASGTNMDEGSKKLATEEYVNEKITEAIPISATASVGQTIVVSAVDENGKPTAWKAVDAPVNVIIKITKTGDGEPTAELIEGTYETICRAFEENKIINVSLFYVSLDSDTGMPFHYYCVHSGINAEGFEIIYTSDETYIYYIRPDNTIELELD